MGIFSSAPEVSTTPQNRQSYSDCDSPPSYFREPSSSRSQRISITNRQRSTRLSEEERKKLLQQRKQNREKARKEEEKNRKKKKSRLKQRLELLDEDAKETCKKYKVQWENTDKERGGERLECWKAIKNPNLNCFMNASMQSLLSLPELVKYFSGCSDGDLAKEKKSYFSKELYPNAKISCLMQDLFKQCYDSDAPELDVTKIRSKFKDDFTETEMHDSGEFILSLLNTLENELNPPDQQFNTKDIWHYLQVWKKYQETYPSIINKLFVGMEQTIFRCQKCFHESKMYDMFKNISIQCTPEAPIKGFIAFLSQLKSPQECKMKCKNCDSKKSFIIKKRIIRYPKYLMLVIGRGGPSTQDQISGFVDYPHSFVQFDPQSDHEIKYTLNNVIANRTVHYSTYCKRGSKWVHLENTDVKAIHPSELKNEDAYILFYEAKDLIVD
ncbi:unnamed protein product [Moneuplotes crassus]|uniref:ubiquitinyl hydrolase 1 n=1 Tax=Euplotes crassus TaxID=5936 RepID=A0AAD1UNK5_EUPCR|nr:unnamed protein product [Moneuplotes crassus]